ncbi:hypothetical protein ACHAXS_014165 [Conticribra weissflogii]
MTTNESTTPTPTRSASRSTCSASLSLTSSTTTPSMPSSLTHFPTSTTATSSATFIPRSDIRGHGYQPTTNQPKKSSHGSPFNSSFHSHLEQIQQYLKNNIDHFPPNLPNNRNNSNASNLTNLLAGTLAFYYTAMASTYIQWKILKISTGTRPTAIPAVLGAATVALGSWMGHLAGVAATSAANAVGSANADGAPNAVGNYGYRHEHVCEGKRSNDGIARWKDRLVGTVQSAPKMGGAAFRSTWEMTRPMIVFGSDSTTKKERRERTEAWMHAARICIIGLVTYKTLLRSHFTSISPSSYTARGSFARIGIPAPPNFNYATSSQRRTLERIGKWWGCHTCGSRMLFSNIADKHVPKFHGDHIPPVSVAKQMNERWFRRKSGWKVSQKFYPQCRNCSNKQGGLLSKAISAGHRNLHSVGGGEESYFHGRRMRIGHVAGGLVAVLSVGRVEGRGCVGENGEVEIVQASRARVLCYEEWARNFATGVGQKVDDLLKRFQ